MDTIDKVVSVAIAEIVFEDTRAAGRKSIKVGVADDSVLALSRIGKLHLVHLVPVRFLTVQCTLCILCILILQYPVSIYTTARCLVYPVHSSSTLSITQTMHRPSPPSELTYIVNTST